MNNCKYLYIAFCLMWLMAYPASVTGQTFGTYESAEMPVASMSGSVGASSMYVGTTSLPQSEISEPFSASAPSRGPRRSPGSGGTGKTDVENPALPIGDGVGVLMLLAILFAVGKGVAIRAKKRVL